MNKSKGGLGLVLIQDRRLRVDSFIVRTQSAIRADGTPSAQVSVAVSAASKRRSVFFRS
jgi:hypothetical protein